MQRSSLATSWLPWVLFAFCFGALTMSIYNQRAQATSSSVPAPAQPTATPTLEAAIEVHGSIEVSRVVAPQDGWIALYRTAPNGTPAYEAVLGKHQVSAGENTNLNVPLNAPVTADEQLIAVLHKDAGTAGVFEYPNGADAPLSVGGAPVAILFTPQQGTLSAPQSTPTPTLVASLELDPNGSGTTSPPLPATPGAPGVEVTPPVTLTPTAPLLSTPTGNLGYPPPLDTTPLDGTTPTPTPYDESTLPLDGSPATPTPYDDGSIPYTPTTTALPPGLEPTSTLVPPQGQAAGAPTATPTTIGGYPGPEGTATTTPTTSTSDAYDATPTATPSIDAAGITTPTPTIDGTPTATPTSVGNGTVATSTSTATAINGTPTSSTATPTGTTSTPTTTSTTLTPTTTSTTPTPTTTSTGQPTSTVPTPTPTQEQPTATSTAVADGTPVIIVAPSQAIVNRSVVLDTVVAAQSGWLVLDKIDTQTPPTFDGTGGVFYIEAGTHQNVRVPVTMPVERGDQLIVQLHEDQGITYTYEYPDGPDVPVEVNGSPVTASFLVEGTATPQRLPDTGAGARARGWGAVAFVLLISGVLLRRWQARMLRATINNGTRS